MKIYEVIATLNDTRLVYHTWATSPVRAVSKARVMMFAYPSGPYRGFTGELFTYVATAMECSSCKARNPPLWFVSYALINKVVPVCSQCLSSVLDPLLPQTVVAIIPTEGVAHE